MSHGGTHLPGENAEQGFNFSTFFIKNPVTTIIMMLIIALLGLRSFFSMPLELFPNIEFPVVVVQTVYPGAAPAEVETLVTKPIEDALSGINGLKTLTSTSNDGVSQVICEMELEIASKDAANDIRDKVSGILWKLPKDVRPPAYLSFSSSMMPIVNYAITGNMSDVALSTYMKDIIKPKLERIKGIAQVQLLGNVERTYEVALNPERLQAYNLSLPGVFQSIQAENYNLPGGKVNADPRELTLRTMGKFQSLEDLSRMYVTTPGGAQVQLKNLGTVRDTIKDRATYAAIDGQDAVFFSIIKQTDANSVEVVHALDKKIAEIAPTLPAGMKITKASDTTHFIEQSNEAVWEHLIIGALLAVLVLFVFLRNWMAMLISGLAIPISIVGAFIPMHLFGFTFNNITMMALSLVVGILVDDAVVDLENIFRHLEAGETPLKAAINATGEIQLAVTATTLTIVGVFLPMSFMSGYIGKFFKSFGLTVTFSVLFSLLVARTLTPMMSAYLLKVKPKEGHTLREEGSLAGRYPSILAWCLSHRWVVVLVATVAFIGGISLNAFIQKGFMASADRGEFVLRIKLPKGSTLNETAGIANNVARKVKDLDGVKNVITMIGAYGHVDEARLDVLLVEKKARSKSDKELGKMAREMFASYTGAQVLADELSMVGGGNNKPVDIWLHGDSLEEMRVYSDKIAALMRKNPAVFADVETSLGEEKPELRIIPDRVRMAQNGIQSTALANTLRLATTGETPNTMTIGANEVDVWVRLDPAYRKDASSLGSLMVQGQRGSTSLAAIANLETGGGYASIERMNRQRLVHVTSNLIPGVSVGTATDYVTKEVLPKVQLPPSLSLEMGGQAEQQKDAFNGFGQAMVMGIVLIFFILALQFSSFLHPLTIMFSLPLSISGAFLGLLLFNKELGMMSLIGVIMLMGIVTKNAILIVDFVLTMRDRGYSRREAVIRGAQVRMRPILMTTAAMVLGMMPMALGIGAGAEFRSPMAVVVIGGLLTSTLLTLFVIPVAYTLMDDMKEFFMRKVFRRNARVVTEEADASLVNV
ncbi:MAG TPA: efflux RND transporter permease subunit [Pantanalinema sp.]